MRARWLEQLASRTVLWGPCHNSRICCTHERTAVWLLPAADAANVCALQGGSFAYISPVLAITVSVQASMTFETEHERFLVSAARGGSLPPPAL